MDIENNDGGRDNRQRRIRQYKEVTPVPAAGEVLLQVLAAGVNTWYSKTVTDATNTFRLFKEPIAVAAL